MRLFVSPHNDDAVLFACWTLLRESPLVLTVFDSYVQPSRGVPGCDALTRRNEDLAAIRGVLGCAVQFGAVRDDMPVDSIRNDVRTALARWKPDEVWLPAVEGGGHDQHNLVGEIGADVFTGATIHRYTTYTRAGGKTRTERQVTIERGSWIGRKLRALACYESQHQLDARLGCSSWFVGDLSEYYV